MEIYKIANGLYVARGHYDSHYFSVSGNTAESTMQELSTAIAIYRSQKAWGLI